MFNTEFRLNELNLLEQVFFINSRGSFFDEKVGTVFLLHLKKRQKEYNCNVYRVSTYVRHGGNDIDEETSS